MGSAIDRLAAEMMKLSDAEWARLVALREQQLAPQGEASSAEHPLAEAGTMQVTDERNHGGNSA